MFSRVAIFILYIHFTNAQQHSTLSAKFLSARCQSFDPTWLNVVMCRVKSYSRNSTVLNLVLNLVKKIEEPNDVTMELFIKSVTSFSPFWPATKFEFCSSMRNEGLMGKWVFFLVGFYRDSVPHLFRQCPFEVGILDLQNLTVDNNKQYPMSQWIPQATYKMRVSIAQKKKKVFQLDLQFDLKSSLDWSRWGPNGR